MLVFLQLLTIVTMTGITYLVFQAFGNPRETLLYTKEEKEQWDSVIAQPLGSWFTTTNVVGTLTLFATVYLFFIGSSKLFGWWVFLCSISIWGGAFVTNYFTRAVCSNEYIRRLLESPDQTGGVIASVFWRPARSARHTAGIIKWLSLVNIAFFVWLDFALFADISGRLLGVNHLAGKLALLVFCCLTIFYFTFRYGLRGFVFADLFQSPVVALASLFLLGGSLFLTFSAGNTIASAVRVGNLFNPILSTRECVLFAFHVSFVNLFLVLVTEPHWLRLWIFKDKETALQVRSVSWTASIWIVLILVGFLASFHSNGKVGEDAVVGLLSKLSLISPVFLVAFWLGGVAALFSSADAQIYSFLVVREFDLKTGKLRTRLMETLDPLRLSLMMSAAFALTYYLVRELNIPFEKIIFFIIPLNLNIFPAFMLAARGLPQNPVYICASLLLYCGCSILGLRQPSDVYLWTLAAALMPLLVGVAAVEISDRIEKRRLVHAV